MLTCLSYHIENVFNLNLSKLISSSIIAFTFLLIFLCSESLAQPYIYYSSLFKETQYEHLETVKRYNLSTNKDENFLPEETIGEYVFPHSEPTQKYLIVGVHNMGYYLYNCSNPNSEIELEKFDNVGLPEFLFSSRKNILCIFTEHYGRENPIKLSVLDLSTLNIISEVGVPAYVDYNTLMKPRRNSFFSSDENKLYFFCLDTLTRSDQVWTYSFKEKSVVQKHNLSDFINEKSDGYNLTFGRNGKGIISSIPLFTNPIKDFYFRVYDFDNNIGYASIYYPNLSEAYLFGVNRLLLVMETFEEDSLSYDHSGIGNIYDYEDGKLVKGFVLPPKGEIYTFDNYPNDIYYVINFDSQERKIFKISVNPTTKEISVIQTNK